MQSVIQDLRFTLRQLRKEKTFALTAILSLALGIGATTAVFSVIYGILIEPYPYKDARRMVHVQLLDKEGRSQSLLFNNGQEYGELLQARCVDDIFMQNTNTVTMTGSGQLPVSVQMGQYTDNLFTYMGVSPTLGRQFTPADITNGQPSQVAVLSYLFWKKQYGAGRDVLGKTIELNHKSYTIIGVAGPRFTWGDDDVYVPNPVTADPKDYHNSFIKLKPGVSLEAARAELEPLVLEFAKRDPKAFPPVAHIKAVTLNEQVLGQFAGTLLLLFSAVALLLIIGCANVSILMLARGTARRHELALRASVGASRWRIIRQLLGESVLLSLLGAVLGILAAWYGVKAVAAALPFYSFPHEAAIRLSIPVLAFSVLIALLTGILFGMSPALQLSRPNLNELIQSGARHSGNASGRRTHRLLIAGQVALTMVLLVLAGTATRAFIAAYRVPLGYDADKVTSLNLALPRKSYLKWEERANKFETIRQTVASAPGVEEAAVVSTWTPPMQGFTAPMEIQSKQDVTGMQTGLVLSSPQVFTTLGIPLVRGRVFTDAEVQRAAHVALVNQAFVNKYLSGVDPIGQQLRSAGLKVEFADLVFAEGNDGWFEIVGVVGDARNNAGFRNASGNGKEKPIEPAVYVPHTVILPPQVSLMVRTRGNAAEAIRAAQQRLQALDPEIAVVAQHPLTWYLETMIWGQFRFIMALFAVFSGLGLVLAATGLYSVVSYTVNQRNQEMGIRMALGAERAQIVRLVLRSVAGTVGMGIALGLTLAITLNRVVSLWVQSSSRDPLVLLGVAVLLAGIALLACMWPARRAASVDPMRVLRTD
jgi:predicted permease